MRGKTKIIGAAVIILIVFAGFIIGNVLGNLHNKKSKTGVSQTRVLQESTITDTDDSQDTDPLLEVGEVEEEEEEEEATVEENVFDKNDLYQYLGGDWEELKGLFDDKSITSNPAQGGNSDIMYHEYEHLTVFTKKEDGTERVYRIRNYGNPQYSMMGVSIGMEAAEAKDIISKDCIEEIPIRSSLTYCYSAVVPEYNYILFTSERLDKVDRLECVYNYNPNDAVYAMNNRELDKNGYFELSSGSKNKESYYGAMSSLICGYGNKSTGLGHNSKDEVVYRCLEISTLYPDPQNSTAFLYDDAKVTCSWGNIINVDGNVIPNADYNNLKSEETYVKTQNTFMDDNVYSHYWMIFLPDNPDIAGKQTITIDMRGEVKTIEIELKYLGDYENGQGWKLVAAEETQN